MGHTGGEYGEPGVPAPSQHSRPWREMTSPLTHRLMVHLLAALLISQVGAAPHRGGRDLKKSCENSEWWDSQQTKCAPCEPCQPDIMYGSDRGFINEVCKRNNPRPINPTCGIYRHCTFLFSLDCPSTETTPPEGTTSPSNHSSSSPPSSPSSPPFLSSAPSSVSSHGGLGGTPWQAILPAVLVAMVLGIGVICAVCVIRTRRSGSPTSSSKGSRSSSNRSSLLDKPDVRSEPDEQNVLLPSPATPSHGTASEQLTGAGVRQAAEPLPRYIPRPTEHQLAEEGTDHLFVVEQKPENPVREGASLSLMCVVHVPNMSSVHVRWHHKFTGRNLFGTNIRITEFKIHDSGEYLVHIHGRDPATNSLIYNTITWTVRHCGEGEDFRDGVQHSLEDVRKIPDSGSPSQDEGVSSRGQSLLSLGWYSSLSSMDNTSSLVDYDRTSPPTEGTDDRYILPSGAEAATPLDFIISSWEVSPIPRTADMACRLFLRELLVQPDTLVQLAVLLDHNNTVLRGFAVTEGRMTQQQIKYVEYCTRGEGNTVKGFITYITGYQGQHDLTVYDFLKFVSDKRAPYMQQVIHILHNTHPDCRACDDLFRKHCPAEASEPRDVCYTPEGPRLKYHDYTRYKTCAETMNELLNECMDSQNFRQGIKTQLDPRPDIWQGIGRDLGGFSHVLLQNLEYHYQSPRGNLDLSASLKLLEQLVTIYPDLKVAALNEWLADHHHGNVIVSVLAFHNTRTKVCQQCRDHFPPRLPRPRGPAHGFFPTV